MKRMLNAAASFRVEAASQVYKHTQEPVKKGDLSIEVDRRIHNVWYSLRNYTLDLCGGRSAPLELKFWRLKGKIFELTLNSCMI